MIHSYRRCIPTKAATRQALRPIRPLMSEGDWRSQKIINFVSSWCCLYRTYTIIKQHIKHDVCMIKCLSRSLSTRSHERTPLICEQVNLLGSSVSVKGLDEWNKGMHLKWGLKTKDWSDRRTFRNNMTTTDYRRRFTGNPQILTDTMTSSLTTLLRSKQPQDEP